MFYLWLKAFHIVAVVVWMAGLLMYPRLKIYQLNDEPGGKLFEEMKQAGERMRKIIMTPALIATWVLGLGMVVLNPTIVSGAVWFPVKFLIVILLSGMHGWFIGQGKKIDAGIPAASAKKLRVLNEVPAVGLVLIAILVIVKPF